MTSAAASWFYYALLGATVALLVALGGFALWYAFPFWLDELGPGGEVTLGLVSSIFEYVVILAFTTVLSTLILARIRQQRRRREEEEAAQRAAAARRAEAEAIAEALRTRFSASIPLLAAIARYIDAMSKTMRPLLEALRRAPVTDGAARPATLGELTPILDAYYVWQVEAGNLAMNAAELQTLAAGLRQRGHALGMSESDFADADGLVLRLGGLARVSGFAAEIVYHSIHSVFRSADRFGQTLRILDCYRVTDLLFATSLALMDYIERSDTLGSDQDPERQARAKRAMAELKRGVSGLAKNLAANERLFRAEMGDHAATA